LQSIFASHFFAAMFPAYFIHFHFANPGCFPVIHPVKPNPPITMGSFSSFHALHMKNCFSVEGVCSPLSGGDSENDTRSPGAVQIGPGKRAMGSN
jgi:hypothetical protein